MSYRPLPYFGRTATDNGKMSFLVFDSGFLFFRWVTTTQMR